MSSIITLLPNLIKELDSTLASRILDFMRMNPPTFHGTKVDEDPQAFIYEFFKVVDAMGVTPREKAELASYKLNDVAQVLFEQWRVDRPLQDRSG